MLLFSPALRCSWPSPRTSTSARHGCHVASELHLSAYQGTGGLNAAVTGDSLALTWDGDRNQELRLRFGINNGTPTIAELAARRKGGAWGRSQPT